MVDESNLQRQVLHAADRVGMAKTESAEMTLNALNPDVAVDPAPRAAGRAQRRARWSPRYDVIVDGTDNFETRYLLNDAAVAHRKPVVHGSIYRWDGQVTTFVPYEGPCYRCLYPTQPPDELAPACAVAGVLGVLPGIIGLLQANEVIKLVLGVGETLAGRMLLFDAMTTVFDEIRLWRDPACPACGDGVAESQPMAAAGLVSQVRIPPVLRERWAANATSTPTGDTVGRGPVGPLRCAIPGLRDRVTVDGLLSPFVNVYVNGRDVRYGDGLETAVGPDRPGHPAAGHGRRRVGLTP